MTEPEWHPTADPRIPQQYGGWTRADWAVISFLMAPFALIIAYCLYKIITGG